MPDGAVSIQWKDRLFKKPCLLRIAYKHSEHVKINFYKNSLFLNQTLNYNYFKNTSINEAYTSHIF